MGLTPVLDEVGASRLLLALLLEAGGADLLESGAGALLEEEIIYIYIYTYIYI
jgi:hypothetical protein